MDEKKLQLLANMPEKKIYLLSTRPIEPMMISEADAYNIIIDSKSFIKTAPIINDALRKRITSLLSQSSTIVFTSMNAAEAVADQLNGAMPKWNIYCLGTATRKIITQGFSNSYISGTGENASSLADVIIKDDVRNLVFFCGNQRRDELPDKLTNHDIGVEELVVYDTIATPELVVVVYDGILFFSPSAVESFFSVNAVPPETILFSIGSTTSACIRQYSANRIIESDRPGKKNLVQKSINYFAKIQTHEQP